MERLYIKVLLQKYTLGFHLETLNNMQQPILTPQQLEAYNRGEVVTIQKVKEVKRVMPQPQKKVFFCEYNGLVSFAWFGESINWSWQNYLAFYTQEELQKQMQYIEAVSYIRTYIANNFGEWKPNWYDHYEEKWSVQYNHSNEKWRIEPNQYMQHVHPYPQLRKPEQAEQFLADCEPQLNILRDFFN